MRPESNYKFGHKRASILAWRLFLLYKTRGVVYQARVMSPEPEHAQSQPPSSPAEPSKSGDGKLLIVGLRCGQMGNRLTLFANLVAYAAEHGHRLINVTFHSYAALFETTRQNIYCRYPVPARRSWLDLIPGVAGVIRKTRIFVHIIRRVSLLNEKLPVFGKKVVTLRERPGQLIILLETPEVQAQIEDARVVFVHGWIFRAPAAMRRQAEKVRAYFRPIAVYEQASSEAVAPLRRQGEVLVGVHIRHADQRTWLGGKYFFPASRYAQWMNEMVEQFPGKKVSFLICSAEPRHRDEFPGLSVGFGPGSPLGDMHALAKCDYILGAVSSFSQWASFYGDKPLYQVRDGNDRLELKKFRVSYLDEIPR